MTRIIKIEGGISDEDIREILIPTVVEAMGEDDEVIVKWPAYIWLYILISAIGFITGFVTAFIAGAFGA